MTDVNSHSLGILGVDPKTGRKRNAILIPRNTQLPAQKTRKFVTKQDGQPTVSVKVLEGESFSPDACTTIGRTLISGLPPKLPAGWTIKVTYAYSDNGRFTAHAEVPGTGRHAKLELQRDRNLSTNQISRWRRVIQKSFEDDAFERLLEEALQSSEKPVRDSGDISFPEEIDITDDTPDPIPPIYLTESGGTSRTARRRISADPSTCRFYSRHSDTLSSACLVWLSDIAY